MEKALAGSFALFLAVGTLLVFIEPRPNEGLPLVVEKQVETQTATVLFGGDIFFDRSIRSTMNERGGDFIFSCMRETLEGVDFAVANLEGPITDNVSVSEGSAPGSVENFRFTFPPSTAKLLAEHNIALVNLGNNHILNFGYEGAAATEKYLGAANVEFFGDPEIQSAKAVHIHDVPLAFINYNEFLPKDIGSARGSAEAALAHIAKAKQEGYLPIVYTHWGVEYATTSTPYNQALAHEFIDAGAVLVVGSHPHVVEESEKYNGATIYYSLGNFIFDQYFSDDVTHGLLLKVVFEEGGIKTISEIPTVLSKDRRTCPTAWH